MKQTKVHVHVMGHPYDVVIGSAIVRLCGETLREWSSAAKVALITDEIVARHQGLLVSASLAQAGFEVLDLSIDPGEPSKNWANAGQLLEAMAKAGMSRNDLVVALGGGVVGDLAGFVAATYLRGVDFAQIPTTLLAMVDSSVGGKTGVDLKAGKNLAGAFKQPIAVIADTRVLSTLPDEEWRSGLAEVAKSAIIGGDDFLDWLEANAEALLKRKEDVVIEAVRRCVEFKAGVVESDEKEQGPRECLNYGHTFGHAAEKVAGYGTLTHGEAVAEGIRFAARLAVELGGADIEFVRRQDRLLAALGLSPMSRRLEPGSLLSAMHSDKKTREGTVRFVLAEKPGVWACEAVSDVTITAHLDAWAASKRRR